jgi:predicted alpha/beta superfamily hydrolase
MMLNHPSVFEKYIMLGPSLWVEKGQMIKQANKLQSSAKITAYFAVGSLEYDARGSMVDDVKLFYSDLPKGKEFKSKLEIIDDENHVSMVPTALTKGFKFLFSK